ncbi:MAG: hypothetical protein ABH950_02755 [Candidatus Altiarchaeota archaeon]
MSRLSNSFVLFVALALFILAILFLMGIIGFFLVEQQEGDEGLSNGIVTSSTSLLDLSTVSSLTSTTSTIEIIEIVENESEKVNESAEEALSVHISPTPVYRRDRLKVKVSDSEGNALPDVQILIDKSKEAKTDDTGIAYVVASSHGPHVLSAEKEGYLSANVSLDVDESRYGQSLAVRRLLSTDERQRAISVGKASLRVYETPICPNCRKVKDFTADVIAANRDCILYEVINLWTYQKELEGRFPVMTTPIVEIEGSGRTFQMNGLISKNTLQKRLESSMTGDCVFQWT